MFCKHSSFTKIQERIGSIEKPCFSIARKGDFSKFLMCWEAVKFSEKPGIYVQIIKENVDSFFKVPLMTLIILQTSSHLTEELIEF